MRKITGRLTFLAILVLALIGGAASVVHGLHTPQAMAASSQSRAAAVGDTATNTATATSTAANTSTATATNTAVNTATATATITATATATHTAVPATPSVTATATATPPPGSPTTAYFAEGYTGLAATNGRATFTEVLNILNPSASITAPITITYYIQGASSSTTMTVTRTANPHSVLRESVNTDVGNDKIVAAVVTSPRRVYATRTMTRVSTTGQRLDSSTTLAATAPSTSWGFAEGYTGVTFQEYLTVLNPTNTQANVNILLAPQASTDAGARTLNFTVPPLSRVTENIRGLNQGNSAQSVGMLIGSDQPIVPERVLYFGDGAGSGKFGSTVSAGVTTPSTSQGFAFGSSGGATSTGSGLNSVGNQDFITLLNPSLSAAANVAVTFHSVSGQQIGQPVSVTLAPGTRRTVIANTSLGTSAVNVFSASLNSTAPIDAESAQYFSGSPNIGSHPGVDFPGQASATSDAFLTDISTQLAGGIDVTRDLYLYNPGAAPIQVAATYFGGNGGTTNATYTVPAGGVFNASVDSDTQASLPPGAVGAELKATSGSFIAYAVGLTSDGLSATEDIGIPAY